MNIKDNGLSITFSRQEFDDIIRALDELEAMKNKYKYPEWANGFDVNTELRVLEIHRKLKSI